MDEESAKKREAREHVEKVCARIREHTGAVAIGLDMAAQEDNWGLCVLLLGEEAASLELLLPRPATRADGEPAAVLRLLPKREHVAALLEAAREREGALAVDVPFGWPIEHGEFTSRWSAVGRARVEIPERQEFERRLCDRVFRDRLGTTPFAVGADAIAQPAFVWCKTLQFLGARVGAVDVGLRPFTERFATFETYPAAFVRNVLPDHRDYKSVPERRKSLLKKLEARLPFSLSGDAKSWMTWAVRQKGSPDAFDAFLCALTAWDHLRAREGKVRLTTPHVLLGRPPTTAEARRIEREGWILVRVPASLD